jgi:hypothetical protein
LGGEGVPIINNRVQDPLSAIESANFAFNISEGMEFVKPGFGVRNSSEWGPTRSGWVLKQEPPDLKVRFLLNRNFFPRCVIPDRQYFDVKYIQMVESVFVPTGGIAES